MSEALRKVSSIRRILCGVVLLLLGYSASTSGGEFRALPQPVVHSLDLANIDGTRFDLDRYHGNVVVINFWATWCPPCVEEMPELEKLRQRVRSRGFEVLAVNMAEPKQSVRDFATVVDVSFPLLLDVNGTAVREWGVYALPTSFLVNTQGQVTHAIVGVPDWNGHGVRMLIDSMLAEK